MEIHGLARLKAIRLRTSTESGSHVLYAQEPTSGRLTKLSNELAQAIIKFKKHLTGEKSSLSEGELESLAVFGAYLDRIAQGSVASKAKFNPLFSIFSLFSPAPYQRYLLPLSKAVVSKTGAAVLVLCCLLVLWISSTTNFALFSEVGNVFSVRALLIFAFLAPFLKMFHEFGHVLMATRFGVPVRDAGILMVALYPLPFVDCTEADFRAKRQGRVIISLGGLFADLTLAMAAFFIWHVAENDVVRQLCTSIFVFNTLTTLVFNINPLLKLDGYFALSDLLHRRNFYQEAMDANRRLRGQFSRFMFVEAFQNLKQNVVQLFYSVLSIAYKIYILLFIVWTLVPQFFGLGLLIAFWGAAVMFLVPILSEEKPMTTASHTWKWRTILLIFLTVIAFLPMKYRVNILVSLDIENAYQVRVASNGVIAEQFQAGEVKAGDILSVLVNKNLETDIYVAREDRVLYSLIYEASRQSDPLGNEAALEQLSSAESRLKRLEERNVALLVKAKHDGSFWPLREASPGAWLRNGSSIGVLVPDMNVSHLIGNFPEVYAEKFQEGATGVKLLGNGSRWKAPDGQVNVDLLRAAQDQNSGTRNFLIKADAALSPLDAIKTRLHLQLTFPAEPLWRHVVFHYHHLRIEFLAKQDANNAS